GDAAVGGADEVDGGSGGEEVAGEAVVVPTGDGRVGGVRADAVRDVAVGGRGAHGVERGAGEREDAARAGEAGASVGDDVEAAEGEVPVQRAGAFDDGAPREVEE